MRVLLLIAAILGGTGVALGAFGAHALKGRLSDEARSNYQTGVHYQLIHALAIGVVVALTPRWISQGVGAWVSGLFIAGVIGFSGSLYGLTTGVVKGRWGLVTPLGGLCFLAGWALLAVRALA